MWVFFTAKTDVCKLSLISAPSSQSSGIISSSESFFWKIINKLITYNNMYKKKSEN